MSDIQCAGTIDDDGKIIEISLEAHEVKIDFSSDIDFTGLVSVLTEKIDVGNQVNFRIDDSEDEKVKLIVETIRSIFDSYNESLNEPEEDGADDEVSSME